VNLATGALRWRRAFPEWGNRRYDGFDPAEIRRVFVQGEDVFAHVGSRSVALALADGTSRWEKDGPVDVLSGDRLYAATVQEYFVRKSADGRARRFPLAYGAPRALASLSRTDIAVALVSETHAFLRSRESALVAVDREMGKYASAPPTGGRPQHARSRQRGGTAVLPERVAAILPGACRDGLAS
jgi:hypothetical protein